MTARGLRYLYLSALRTRAPVLELVALALTVLEFFADTKAEVGSTWALTALLGGALAAWLVGAMLAGEADPQADMVAARAGRAPGAAAALRAAGRRRRDARLRLLHRLSAAADRRRPRRLPEAPGATDVLAAILAQLACGLLGGAIGVGFAPPRVDRRATAALATLAALLALIIISIPLGRFGGPVAIATALGDAPLHHLTGAEIEALASCLVLLAATALVVRAWTRRAGARPVLLPLLCVEGVAPRPIPSATAADEGQRRPALAGSIGAGRA